MKRRPSADLPLLLVLGHVENYSSKLANHFPQVDIVRPGTSEIVEKGRSNNSPDQIAFNATLTDGVFLNFHLQCGAIAPKFFASTHGTAETCSPHLDWRIFGDKGEIRVVSPGTWPINALTEDVRIEVFVFDEDNINGRQRQEIERALNLADELEEVPLAARNIGRLYEAFAAPEKVLEIPHPTFECAVKKHQLIEDMYKQSGF